ncbi:thioesterase domain-containing protein, partial [Streptomyces lasiicapitis]|uniref:thioesterase domain-containing protein n=1 Tax=Streptomyces lasiicapitis TaxID=1923961 RepID=UPI003694F12B
PTHGVTRPPSAPPAPPPGPGAPLAPPAPPTTLGDPIEAEALLATYGRGRPAHAPLWLGSLKSNVGHTAAAAGVGGVIKTVLALREGVLPPTLHVDEPTPHVNWSSGAVELLTESRPWPDTGRARRAGVSSFGISGTNAHVIVEQAPDDDVVEQAPDDDMVEQAPDEPDRSEVAPAASLPTVPWVLSGGTEEALREQADRLRVFVGQRTELLSADIARSLTATRACLEHRAVVLGQDRDALMAALSALARGEDDVPDVVHGSARGRGRVAFSFSGLVGRGGGWAVLARELYARVPVFASAAEETRAAFAAVLEPDLEPDVEPDLDPFPDPDDPDPVLDQVALFTAELALFRLLERWGVTPDALLGHSVGEVTAAHCAGVLSLADAAALVVALAREASDEPSSSGGEAGDGIRRTVKELTFRPPVIPLASGRTGTPVSYEELSSPEHWVRLARVDDVPSADAEPWLSSQGVYGQLSLGADGTGADGVTDMEALPRALARLHVGGVPVGWDRMLTDCGARLVDLPTYAFRNQRYWPESTALPLGAARPRGATVPVLTDRGREVRDRLAGADADERARLLAALVRTHVAAVLRLPDADEVDDERPLPELGFDSLTAVDLRNRLGADTGLRLPPALVFQHPTVTDLTRHLAAEWETTGPAHDDSDAPGRDIPGPDVAPGDPSQSQFTLGPLLARASEQGRTEEFHELVRRVAQFRPAFDVPEERLRPPHVRLARGSAAASLVCFPTFAVGSGAPQYARLAAASGGAHDVWVQPVPGFRRQESLPVSVGALAELLADGVEQCADGGPVVLLGYSAGGWIAHATAAVLEARGTRPDAVVLLDTHWPDSPALADLHARIEHARTTGAPDVLWAEEAVDDAYLTAMAHYTGLFRAWTPQEIDAPTLLVRASESPLGEPPLAEPQLADAPLAEAPEDWRPHWHLPHTAVDTAGTHFSLIREHSEPTLRAVRDWLAASAPAPVPTQGAE